MRSVRGFFNTVFTPLARVMPRVQPNTLTAVSVFAGLAAGTCFWLAHRGTSFYALAALLLAVSGATDALDGIVARMYGRTTRLGELLDHLGDRLTEVAVLGGIAVSPGTTFGLGIAVLVATLLVSYLGTQVEATFGVRDYSGLGKAEQFVALVAFALARAMRPDLAVPLAGWSVTLPDAFLVALGLGTLAGMWHRLRQVQALAAADHRP